MTAARFIRELIPCAAPNRLLKAFISVETYAEKDTKVSMRGTRRGLYTNSRISVFFSFVIFKAMTLEHQPRKMNG